ncbi:MAG: hypothetical protein IPO19_03905 [Rhodoferax sp.]|nr:hypothetical protein [Rhodoferax sp.]MBK9235242.1 hypothetical protein [Rhodoferax sp.]
MRFFRDLSFSAASALLAGVGSALWGVLAGAVALFVQQYRRQPMLRG